ncbi:uncharacterized protein LOC129742796 [Uranotaenia lowii]|uniref:uncharacterized protein LOC129742796 n=1 Tax=Uranotaenia lowii TaxID=190385 RepID=UPI0024797E04|nr:uncharacterized protein LOC129742796 [Uranotaenia lowii]
MGMNMYNRNDATAAGQRSRFDYYYSTSSQASSVENQRYHDQTSLFGDPVLAQAGQRHPDLLEGGDLYQNLKNNIELYHSKLYNEQETARQAERDRLFNEFTNNNIGSKGRTTTMANISSTTASSAATTTSGSSDGAAVGGPKGSIGSAMTSSYAGEPATRRYSRVHSAANIGLNITGPRNPLADMDLLKHNDWINFSDYEYQNSLIPKTTMAVAEVQQFANNNLNKPIENGVFQNPRLNALNAPRQTATTRSRRNSMSDNLYAASTTSLGGFESLDNFKNSPFTVLGGEPNYLTLGATGLQPDSTVDAMSEYERVLQLNRSGATTPILKDKITTGSNFRVSEARQQKQRAFTIISESLPKSHSFDVSSGYQPYPIRHPLGAPRILSASSLGNNTFYEKGANSLKPPMEDSFLAYQRRYSEVSLASSAKRKKGKGVKKGAKSKNKKSDGHGESVETLPNPRRSHRGVLGVFNKLRISPGKQMHAKSAKLNVPGASDEGGSTTPTNSESTEQADIPHHQMKNMKLFSFKPFSGRPMLSPVPDKSSMENSVADLNEASPAKGKSGSPTKESKSKLRTPVFNIRGLLSPGRSKNKDGSPEKTHKIMGGIATTAAAAVAAGTAGPTAGTSTGAASAAAGASTAAAVAAAAKQADGKAAEEVPKRRGFSLARAIIDYGKKQDVVEEKKPEEPVGKGRPDGRRERKRNDSEGNGVKTTKKKGKVKAKAKSKKTNARDDYDDYYYEDEKPEKSRSKGGMLRSLASNFSSKGNSSSKRGAQKTPTKAERASSGKRVQKSSATPSGRVGTRGNNAVATTKSGKASERTSSRAAPEKSAKGRDRSDLKSAVGPRGRMLRRTSSASAINVESARKGGRLYEKNAKASDRNGKMLKGADKKTRQSTDSLLKKSDSKGELKQKTGSAKSGSAKEIEKRDSEKSLKKTDSNKSILKANKSDSKSSLFGKRSDSKTSLHLIDAQGSTTKIDPMGSVKDVRGSVTDLGRSPLNTLEEVAVETPPAKAGKATPNKLQSKGSLLSLLSMRSRKQVDPEKGDQSNKPDSRPGTGKSGRLSRMNSASTRNVNEKPGTPGGKDQEFGSRASIREKPGSVKPARKNLSKNNSVLSIKSVAHARSFTNIRPASRENSDLKKNEAMTKVQEGSQEHEDAEGGAAGGTTASATHTMKVTGDGEGQKVSNEYNEKQAQSPELGVDGMQENQSSANTDSMMMQHHQEADDR